MTGLRYELDMPLLCDSETHGHVSKESNTRQALAAAWSRRGLTATATEKATTMKMTPKSPLEQQKQGRVAFVVSSSGEVHSHANSRSAEANSCHLNSLPLYEDCEFFRSLKAFLRLLENTVLSDRQNRVFY
jgi:hypothetical protein